MMKYVLITNDKYLCLQTIAFMRWVALIHPITNQALSAWIHEWENGCLCPLCLQDALQLELHLLKAFYIVLEAMMAPCACRQAKSSILEGTFGSLLHPCILGGKVAWLESKSFLFSLYLIFASGPLMKWWKLIILSIRLEAMMALPHLTQWRDMTLSWTNGFLWPQCLPEDLLLEEQS